MNLVLRSFTESASKFHFLVHERSARLHEHQSMLMHAGVQLNDACVLLLSQQCDCPHESNNTNNANRLSL